MTHEDILFSLKYFVIAISLSVRYVLLMLVYAVLAVVGGTKLLCLYLNNVNYRHSELSFSPTNVKSECLMCS